MPSEVTVAHILKALVLLIEYRLVYHPELEHLYFWAQHLKSAVDALKGLFTDQERAMYLQCEPSSAIPVLYFLNRDLSYLSGWLNERSEVPLYQVVWAIEEVLCRINAVIGSR